MSNWQMQAAAARGGRKRPPSGGMCWIVPNPVPLNSTSIIISGSGFAPNSWVVVNAWFIPQPTVMTDAYGGFSIQYSPSGGFWLAGQSSVQILRPSDLAVLATCYYTVI